MPPWQNVPQTEKVCARQGCSATFMAKRATARYCSDRCKELVRPKRAHNPEVDLRYYERMRADPERVAQRQRVNRERHRAVRDWINAYKIRHGCVDCGYREHAVALDIDHMDGKTANVSMLGSIRAVEAEIERHRCVVRCANCHRVKTWQTRPWERQPTTS